MLVGTEVKAHRLVVHSPWLAHTIHPSIGTNYAQAK